MLDGRPDRPDVIALPPLILAAAIALGLALNFFVPLRLVPDALATLPGIFISLGAVIPAILAFRELRAASTSFDVRKPSAKLVTSGVFEKSRNPIYLGMILLYAGVAFLVNSLWILLLALPLAIILQKGVIEPEEAYLERKFGEQYLRYKSKVRRWI